MCLWKNFGELLENKLGPKILLFVLEIWQKRKIQSIICQPGPKVWMTFFPFEAP